MRTQPEPQWGLPAGQSVSFQTVAADQAAQTLAADVAARLRQAIAARGRAVLHVSGGQSPVALFEALRGQALPWQLVEVSLADERVVPADHPDSNARLVRTHLLQGPASCARFLPLVPPSLALPEPPLGLRAAQSAQSVPLAQLADQADLAGQALRAQGPADVLVLGMGADGHTASIFAGMPNLMQALDPQGASLCLPVAREGLPAGAPHARITQTLAHLLTARHIVLPVHGSDKLQTLRQACRTRELPISYVLHQSLAPVAVWISS
jgi:6-phosphogluconolactonase